MSVDFLRRLPLFAGLSDADLAWLYQQTEPVSLRAGDVLMQEGESGDALYLVLDGEFEVSKRSDRQDIVIAVRAPGEVIGEMALLDDAPRMATVRAARDSRLLRLGVAAFRQLLSTSPSAALATLRTVSARLRQNEALLRQSEKMAALGTLAAGLAHELNNPAAAVGRSADQLRAAVDEWQRRVSEIEAQPLDPAQVEALARLRARSLAGRGRPASLDPLARADQEAALQTWLEARGIDEAWELAPAMVEAGWEQAELGVAGAAFTRDQWPFVARWLAAGAAVFALLDELKTGAAQMTAIVRAVKAYAYLDRAPVQDVDVREGLEDTLVILRHKLKGGVRVVRDYAPDLPRIEAHGSELNQVWTNLLDNAADAMGGQGEITLRTRFLRTRRESSWK